MLDSPRTPADLLAATLRPEILLAVLPGFVVWFRSRRFSRSARAGITVAVLLAVGAFVWTVVQYGHFVPQPVADVFGDVGLNTAWLGATLLVFAPLVLLTVGLLTWPELRGVGAFFCATVLAAGLPYAMRVDLADDADLDRTSQLLLAL